MSDTALIVIDMQKAYFNNEALKNGQDRLVAANNDLISAFKDHDMPVILARTEHQPDKSTWTLNMLDRSSGYLFEKDTDSDFVDGLITDTMPTLVKTRDSAFHGTDLSDRLHTLGIKQLVLTGVSTHSCVLYTAADAYAASFRAILASDAIASHDPTYHRSTLAMLDQEYKQKSLTNKEILRLLED